MRQGFKVWLFEPPQKYNRVTDVWPFHSSTIFHATKLFNRSSRPRGLKKSNYPRSELFSNWVNRPIIRRGNWSQCEVSTSYCSSSHRSELQKNMSTANLQIWAPISTWLSAYYYRFKSKFAITGLESEFWRRSGLFNGDCSSYLSLNWAPQEDCPPPRHHSAIRLFVSDFQVLTSLQRGLQSESKVTILFINLSHKNWASSDYTKSEGVRSL